MFLNQPYRCAVLFKEFSPRGVFLFMKRIAWFSVMLGGLIAVLNILQVAAQERPDLGGVVLNDSGEPVRDASVFIYTAGPRVGPGYI